MFKVWYETKKDGWSPLYAKTQWERAEKDILPSLSFRPIGDIRTPEIITCLKKIENRGAHDVRKRCNQVIGMVFDYAIALGKTDINPAKSTRGAFKTAKTKHQRCMPTKDVPEFLHALENNIGNLQPQTINAMKFLMLTFVRTKEMAEATWNEIDFEKNEWRIDKVRMKMNRDHIVPLSTQVKEILYAQRKMIDDLGLKINWIFPSLVKPKRPMSNGTILGALRRMKFNDRHTGHGFRSLARTMIDENLPYRPEAIERQLSHKSNERLGEAYDRTQFLDERKKMMQDWANYIDTLASQGKVIREKFGM
jgi:integrase